MRLTLRPGDVARTSALGSLQMRWHHGHGDASSEAGRRLRALARFLKRGCLPIFPPQPAGDRYETVQLEALKTHLLLLSSQLSQKQSRALPPDKGF